MNGLRGFQGMNGLRGFQGMNGSRGCQGMNELRGYLSSHYLVILCSRDISRVSRFLRLLAKPGYHTLC